MNIEFYWKDRKRICGLPLSFTRYFLSADRLFVSTGFLNIRDQQVLLYQIKDILVMRSFIQQFFGVGTVIVIPTDPFAPSISLVNVSNPLYVKELMHRLVEQCKKLMGPMPALAAQPPAGAAPDGKK